MNALAVEYSYHNNGDDRERCVVVVTETSSAELLSINEENFCCIGAQLHNAALP